MKRLVYAYLIGLAACFVSISIAYRPQGSYWNILFAALLGISGTAADIFGQQSMTVPMVLAAAVLSLIFVAAEVLRSRGTWLRWVGYGLWVVLAIASFVWFAPPNI